VNAMLVLEWYKLAFISTMWPSTADDSSQVLWKSVTYVSKVEKRGYIYTHTQKHLVVWSRKPNYSPFWGPKKKAEGW